MSLSPSLLNVGDVRAAAVALVDGAGVQVPGFDASRPANAALSTVPTTNVSAVLAAANPARRQVFITNESGKTLFVALAATATATAYTVQIASNQSWVSSLDGYTGAISGVLAGGTGNARVTEVTT